MAEVTGLVFGAVSLATLFSTCAQLFDCFELGRSYRYDYELACTKLDLLKTRLSNCGHELNIQRGAYESVAHSKRWTAEEEDIVGRSLAGIEHILGNTSLLEEKYRLVPSSKRSLGIHSLNSRTEGASYQQNISSTSKFTSSRLSLLRRRTIWAIHDKAKFDDLIDDLSFMMSNLEKVTVMSYRDRLSGSPLKAQQSSQKQPQQATYPQTGTTVKGKQTNEPHAVGFQGSLAPDNRPVSVEGAQQNNGGAVGIQGGATTEGLLALQGKAQAAYEAQKKG